MKTFDEVYEKIQQLEQGELKELGREVKYKNKKLLIRLLIIAFIILAFSEFVAYLIYQPDVDQYSITAIIKNFFGGFIMWGPFMLIIGFVILQMYPHNSEYLERYKNIIIPELICNFYPDVKYYPQKGISFNTYKEAEYNGDIDIFRSEDYIETSINGKHSVQMSDLLVQRLDRDDENKIVHVTMFYGLFAKVSLNKSIKSKLEILLNGSCESKMDSSEFEKYFDVRATDKIIGMQLLTADVMQSLVDFTNNTKIKYDVVIINDSIYLRFHTGDTFESRIRRDGSARKDTIKRYFDILELTYNLTNTIINTVNDVEI